MALMKAHIEIFGYRNAIVTPTPKSIYVDPKKSNKYCEYNFECESTVPITIDFGGGKVVHVHLQ